MPQPTGYPQTDTLNPYLQDIDEQISRVKEDPFYGITTYERCDQEKMIVKESGDPNDPNWKRREYYTRTGLVRIIETGDGPNPNTYIYDTRTQSRFIRGNFNPNNSEHAKQEVTGWLETLSKDGIEVPLGKGYPELEMLMNNAKQDKFIITEMQPGNYYLVIRPDTKYEQGEVFKLGKLGGLERNPVTNTPTYPASCENDNDLFPSIRKLVIKERSKFKPSYDANGDEYVTIQADDSNSHTAQGIFLHELTEDELNVLHRNRPTELDQTLASGTTRELVAIRAAIQGMQFTKWGSLLHLGSQEYENANRENYLNSLRLLAARFGDEAFLEGIKQTMAEHLARIDMESLQPGVIPRSNIGARGNDSMTLARQTILDNYPIPNTMTNLGYDMNVVPLFGDHEFWNYLRTEQPYMYQDILNDLPTNPTQTHQHTPSEIHLPTLLKEYFPEAYKEILAGQSNFITLE